MTALATQSYDFGDVVVRVIERRGEAWFIAKDVSHALGIVNVPHAVSRLDNDEKDDVVIDDVTGRRQEMLAINESGLYSLILTSRKPAALRFKKWVTSEVLPSIRRIGRYDAACTQDDETSGMLQIGAALSSPDDIERLLSAMKVVREARIIFGLEAARRAWLLVGLPDLSPPQATIGRTSGSVKEWLVSRTVAAPGQREQAKILYGNYLDWCEVNGIAPAHQAMFGRALSSAGYISFKSGPMWRLGIALSR